MSVGGWSVASESGGLGVCGSVVECLGFVVASSVGLVGAVAAVLAEPAGWESSLGSRVAGAVVAAMASRWTSRSFLLEDMTVAVLADVLVHSEALLAWAESGDVWGWLIQRARRLVRAEVFRERLGGLCGDANPERLWRRLRDRVGEGLPVVACPEEWAGWDAVVGREPVAVGDDVPAAPAVVGPDDLGPVLGGVVDLLVEAGVDRSTAVAGTCRVLELTVSVGRRAERHTRARQDARAGGLADLGVSERAAGAWMSVVSGSRRLGEESAVVLAVREGRPLKDCQRSWLRLIACDVGVGASVAA